MPIAAKESELNFLIGVTSNIQTQLNTINANLIPAGTKAPFYQAAAPSGWVAANPGSNYVLMSSAAGGTLGGGGGVGHNIVTGCNVVASHTHTVDPAVVTTTSDSHTHTFTAVLSRSANVYDGAAFGTFVPAAPTTGTTGSDSHSHTVNIPSTATTVNTNLAIWQPQYATVLICTKS